MAKQINALFFHSTEDLKSYDLAAFEKDATSNEMHSVWAVDTADALKILSANYSTGFTLVSIGPGDAAIGFWSDFPVGDEIMKDPAAYAERLGLEYTPLLLWSQDAVELSDNEISG